MAEPFWIFISFFILQHTLILSQCQQLNSTIKNEAQFKYKDHLILYKDSQGKDCMFVRPS